MSLNATPFPVDERGVTNIPFLHNEVKQSATQGQACKACSPKRTNPLVCHHRSSSYQIRYAGLAADRQHVHGTVPHSAIAERGVDEEIEAKMLGGVACECIAIVS